MSGNVSAQLSALQQKQPVANGSRPLTGQAAKTVVANQARADAAQQPVRLAGSQLAYGRSVNTGTVNGLITAAGLPADRLSASIVLFARFFSLPIKPETMAATRRQAVAILANAGPANANQANGGQSAQGQHSASGAKTAAETGLVKEAFALAAVAAESKGLAFSANGLEAYAGAIAPVLRKNRDSGERGQHGDGEKREAAMETQGEARQKTGSADSGNVLSAASLKEMALGAAGKEPLVSLLNRLPGRDGKRWIVLPFDFESAGRDFRLSLRVLLDQDGGAGQMALDIAESPGNRLWFFSLENAGAGANTVSQASRLSVCLYPELSQPASGEFINGLSAATGIPAERISVKSIAESSPLQLSVFPENPLLNSVDKAI